MASAVGLASWPRPWYTRRAFVFPVGVFIGAGMSCAVKLEYRQADAEPTGAEAVASPAQAPDASRTVGWALTTMTFPTDELPLAPMLEHQLHLLESNTSRLAGVTVFDNRPPWLNDTRTPQQGDLDRLQSKGVAMVRPLNYSRFDDPAFVARFFQVRDDLQKDVAVTLRDIGAEMPDHGMGNTMFKYNGNQVASNFLGMLSYLERCVDAGDAVDMCAYIDSDIFFHRKKGAQRSLVDLAAELFEANPNVIVYEPPNICHFSSSTVPNGTCSSEPDVFRDTKVITTRHMFIHRKRLIAALPIPISPGKILGRFFEQAFTHALQSQAGPQCRRTLGRGYSMQELDKCKLNYNAGTMRCSGETFAIHPPAMGKWNAETLARAAAEAEQITDAGHAALAGGTSTSQVHNMQQTGTGGSIGIKADARRISPVVIEGTREIIRRMEAGNFTRALHKKSSLLGEALFGVALSDSLASCSQMVGSRKRIQEGMAWHATRGERAAAKLRPRLSI